MFGDKIEPQNIDKNFGYIKYVMVVDTVYSYYAFYFIIYFNITTVNGG